MDKGYESILKCLDENERIIFTTDKNFKFGEKNLLVTGEKFFCISNLGRIYIADKNRILRSIKVIKYDYKERGIKFNVLNKDNIIAINSRDFTDNRSESFIINIKLNDFTEISKKLIDNPFVYNWSKYSVKIDGGVYESAIIDMNEDYLNINTLSYNINLDYLDIIDFKEKNKSLHIISNNKECYNILIYAFNAEINGITNAIKKAKNILNYDDLEFKNYSDINEKTLVLDNSVDATVVDIDGTFKDELDKTISDYYKNELMNGKEEKHIEPKLQKEENINIVENIEIKKPKFYKKSKNCISSYGKLYGYLNSINYKGRQVELIIDNELKIFDKEVNKELISIAFNDYKYTKNDTIIILKKEENMILINLEEEDLELDKFMTNHISNVEYIGYNNDFQPFELIFSEEEIILLQSSKSILKKIKISEIADINILEEILNFESIAITLMNSEIYKIFIIRTSVVNFLKDTYKLKSCKKYKECTQMVRENTFKSMINDELTIFYFGDIIKIKNMIDDFYKSDTKNKKSLVENLYNTAEKVKISCKMIAMYYFEKFDIDIDFKILRFIEELKNIEFCITDLVEKILVSLNNLDSIKTLNSNNEIKTTLSNDMSYIFQKIGLRYEDCIYKSIILNKEVFDYNFDRVIEEISLNVNNFISTEILYYSKIIKIIVDEIAIEKYITNESITEELVNYFVQMQLKSKIDNKTRLKDILINIKKYISYKSISTSDFIDILNLVIF